MMTVVQETRRKERGMVTKFEHSLYVGTKGDESRTIYPNRNRSVHAVLGLVYLGSEGLVHDCSIKESTIELRDNNQN